MPLATIDCSIKSRGASESAQDKLRRWQDYSQVAYMASVPKKMRCAPSQVGFWEPRWVVELSFQQRYPQCLVSWTDIPLLSTFPPRASLNIFFLNPNNHNSCPGPQAVHPNIHNGSEPNRIYQCLAGKCGPDKQWKTTRQYCSYTRQDSRFLPSSWLDAKGRTYHARVSSRDKIFPSLLPFSLVSTQWVRQYLVPSNIRNGISRYATLELPPCTTRPIWYSSRSLKCCKVPVGCNCNLPVLVC